MPAAKIRRQRFAILTNAWLTIFTGTGLKAEGNEVAIEELVLAREGSEIVTP